MLRVSPRSTIFPYTTLFRSQTACRTSSGTDRIPSGGGGSALSPSTRPPVRVCQTPGLSLPACHPPSSTEGRSRSSPGCCRPGVLRSCLCGSVRGQPEVVGRSTSQHLLPHPITSAYDLWASFAAKRPPPPSASDRKSVV